MHHLTLLILAFRAAYPPSDGLFWVLWVFIRFSLINPESSPFESLPTIPGLLLSGFFERSIKARVLPSPTAERHISHPRHRTSHLHREPTSNRIKDFLGRAWRVFGGFTHSSILPAREDLDSSTHPEISGNKASDDIINLVRSRISPQDLARY